MSSPTAPLIPRLALALILAVGFALPYGFAVGFVNEVRKSSARGAGNLRWDDHLFVRTDGVPLIAAATLGRGFDFRTVDGEPVAAPAANDSLSGTTLRVRDEFGTFANLSSWKGRVESFADPADPATYWYFVTTDDSRHGRGRFVGYDAATNAIVGYISTKGLSTAPPSVADEFAIDGRSLQNLSTMFRTYGKSDTGGSAFTPAGPNRASERSQFPPWRVFLHAGGRFLKIDLEQRKVIDLFGVDDVIAVGQINRPLAGKEGNGVKLTSINSFDLWRENHIDYAVRRTDRIVLFNPTDESTVEYRIPAELRDQTFVFYPLPNDEALVTLWQWHFATSAKPHELAWFTRAGDLKQKRSITLQPRSLVQSRREEALIGAIAVPVPVVWSLLPFITDLVTRGEPLRDLASDAWPALLLILVVSASLAIATDRWQRRYNLPRSLGWLAFVFLLGLPGFAGFLLHRRWPVLHVAPPPVPSGLEVFA